MIPHLALATMGYDTTVLSAAIILILFRIIVSCIATVAQAIIAVIVRESIQFILQHAANTDLLQKSYACHWL